MTFEGKVVAITGAAGGVGRSLCRYFIDEGAKIAAIDKNASVDSLAADLKATAGTLFHTVADISEPAQVSWRVRDADRRPGAGRHSGQ